ncbi:site-2 protease family protein, partial [Anaerotignum faecicola]
MENISSLLITIILLGVLVIAHEFGHFIIAKKNGIW